MRANEFITEEIVDELKIDNDNGWGQTPNNANVGYQGLLVQMKPSVFLKLAAELPIDDEAREKIEVMKKHSQSGGAFGAPTLYINIPREWEQGVIKGTPYVRGHEGRHRMNTQMELEGDVPVETHIFISGFKTKNWAKDYQNDYTPEIVDALQNGGVESEDGHFVTARPLFQA